MLTKTLRFSSFLLALAAFTQAGGASAKKKKAEPPPAEDVKLDEDDSSSKKKSKGKADEDKPAEEDKPADEAPPAEQSDDGEKKEEEKPSEAAATSESNDSSPVEQSGKTYNFVGARLRGLIIPTFIIKAFGDGGKTVPAPNFGPEFILRRDGFEYEFAITYTSYVMTHTPFKAPDDPEQAMELVDAHLKVLYLQSDFMWGHDFSPQVGVMYGFGAGLGIVWGPLYRTQAFPVSGGWDYCPALAANDGIDPHRGYCVVDPTLGSDPQHSRGYQEPSWTGGGSKPILFPWLSLQAALRFKPTRHFAARLDAGIGFGQVFFGLGADYGL
jgi:hypothetical protein